MDSQNFAPQGLSAPKVGSLKREMTVGERASAKAAGVGAVRSHEEKQIAGFRGIESAANLLTWNGQFFGMIGAAILGGAAGLIKWSRGKAVINAVFVAPFKAMQDTKLNALHLLPANYMRAVGDIANEAGSKAAERWAPAAHAAAENLSARGTQFAETVAGKVNPAIAPVGGAIQGGMNRFAQTGFGRSVESRMIQFAESRSAANARTHQKLVGKAIGALTQEQPNWFMRTIMRKKAAAIGMPHELSEVAQHLNAATGTEGLHSIGHMERALEALNGIKDAPSSVMKQVSRLTGLVEKAGGKAGAAYAYQEAIQHGLGNIFSVLAKSGGKMSLFAGLIVGGTAAGVSATMLTSKKESKEAKAAYNELLADLGNDQSAFVGAVKKSYQKQQRSGVVGTGVSVVGDVANGALGMAPGSGEAAMIGMSLLPMLTPIFVHDNPVLNAYKSLKEEERTGAPMPEEQKLYHLKQLIGVMPSVASHGGIYNRLVGPIAQHIIDQKLSTKDTVQLLANEAKFTSLSNEVFEKQKAGNKTPEAVNDNSVDKQADKTLMTAENDNQELGRKAERPSMKIGASRALEGKITDTQLGLA